MGKKIEKENKKYDSFRDFLETKYGIMIDDYSKMPETTIPCLYKLYKMKYIDKEVYII